MPPAKKILVLILLVSSFLPTPSRAQGAPVAIGCLAPDAASAILDLIPGATALKNFIIGERPWYDQTICQFRQKVFGAPDNEIFGERYTFAQVNWITNSLIIYVLHPVYGMSNPIDILRQLFSDAGPASLADFAQLGPLGLMVGSMSEMYTSPPASGVDYAKNVLGKISPVTPVHAQGYGFNATDAVQGVWSASRNMVYFLIVILLIAAGFLVMFRVKINPQTVVSVQTLIPKLIITLILVTFSYAIAGLVIDFIFVILTFILGLLQSQGIVTNQAITFFTTPGFEKIFFYYLLTWLTFILATLFTIVGPIIGLLVTLLVMWVLLKVWWLMVKTYLTLIFLIIVGPWQIMLDLIPGQSGFGGWLRNFIANASVFVVVPIMLLFNMLLWQLPTWLGANQFWNLAFQTGLPATPLVGGNFPDLPLFGNKGYFFTIAIGYAILAMIPKVAEMIKDALKVPAFKYGSAIGEPLQFINKWGIQGAGTLAANAYETGRGPLPNTWTDAIGALRSVGVLGKRQ